MGKLISQSCGELQLAVCLPRDMEPFEGDPSTRGRLTSLRNKPQQKQPRQLSVVISDHLTKLHILNTLHSSIVK